MQFQGVSCKTPNSLFLIISTSKTLILFEYRNMMMDLIGKLLCAMVVLLLSAQWAEIAVADFEDDDGDKSVGMKLLNRCGIRALPLLYIDMIWRLLGIWEILPVRRGILYIGGILCRFWLRHFHDFVVERKEPSCATNCTLGRRPLSPCFGVCFKPR